MHPDPIARLANVWRTNTAQVGLADHTDLNLKCNLNSLHSQLIHDTPGIFQENALNTPSAFYCETSLC